MVTESPDVPWAKNYDERLIPRPIDPSPDSFALLFLNFLKSHSIERGRILEIEGENIANMNLFFSSGFEPNIMSPTDKSHLNFDQYGIKFFCHSPYDYWPFEDAHFDFIIDVHTLFLNLDLHQTQLYLENFSRTLVSGGFGATSLENSASQKFIDLFLSYGLKLEKKCENEIFIFKKL